MTSQNNLFRQCRSTRNQVVEKLGRIRLNYLKDMHAHPYCHVSVYLSCILVYSLIGIFSWSLFLGEADFPDPNSQAKQAFDSVEQSKKLFDNIDLTSNTIEQITFVYEWKDGRSENIFNAKNLQTFCEVERRLFFQSDFEFSPCDTQTALDTCVTSNRSLFEGSITALIYRDVGSNSDFNFEDCALLDESSLAAFISDFYGDMEFNQNDPNRLFVDSVTQSTKTRSFLEISDPSKLVVEAKLLSTEADYFDFFGIANNRILRSSYRDPAIRGDIKVTFVSKFLIKNELKGLAPGDALLVIFSIIFVGSWVCYHTGSLFLTFAMTSYVILSIPVSIFIYKIIFGILYFDFVHILVFFLVIGIGIDDVFIVIDQWKQASESFTDDFKILVKTYNVSSGSVFNTSFTTAVAFLVTAISPVVPVSTFGIFAALCVLMNYLFVLTIVPVTVLIWHRNYSQREANYESKASIEEPETKLTLKDLENKHNRLWLKYYIPFVNKYKKQLAGIGFSLGFIGFIAASTVSQLTEEEVFLPNDHSFSLFLQNLENDFVENGADFFTLVEVFHGVKGMERNILSHYSGIEELYEDKVQFDETFNAANFEAQQAMIKLCDRIEAKTCTPGDCFGATTFVDPKPGSVKCTMREFYTFWNAQFDPPIEENNDRDLFFARLREFRDRTPGFENLVGFVDEELKFFANEFRLTMPVPAGGPPTKVYSDFLTEIIKDYEKAAPDTAKTADFSSIEFVQLSIEETLVKVSVQGLLITFPITFMVLLFATTNWILASLSTLTIFFVILSVAGFAFAILQFELGIAECIIAIMIVGLSVDYTVHLGHMYTLAGKKHGFKTRQERFTFAVLGMAPSVLAGGGTTLGASLFLFGCQISFLNKMGALILLTVVFSVYFSLLFLMPACAWIGPGETEGSIEHWKIRWKEFRQKKFWKGR